MGDALDMEGHTSRAFDGDLSSLHMRVVEMGGLVLLQAREAGTAYTDWDLGLADAVLARERHVNGYDKEMDAQALALIARRQPMATDLRAVLAMSRIVAELERAGVEAKKIALTVLGRAGRAGGRPGAATARDARHLARLAVNMVRRSLDALDRLDTDLALQVIVLDRELDDEYADGVRRLLTRAMEDSRFISVALEAAFVLKSLERIGDHARNVARLVISIGTRAVSAAPGTAESASVPPPSPTGAGQG